MHVSQNKTIKSNQLINQENKQLKMLSYILLIAIAIIIIF